MPLDIPDVKRSQSEMDRCHSRRVYVGFIFNRKMYENS